MSAAFASVKGDRSGGRFTVAVKPSKVPAAGEIPMAASDLRQPIARDLPSGQKLQQRPIASTSNIVCSAKRSRRGPSLD